MSDVLPGRPRNVHSYLITADDQTPVRYVARTAAKARAAAYRDFNEMWPLSFREFLARTSLLHMPNIDPVGRRIIVEGTPATHCGFRGQYVRFIRDDGDTILVAHPDDVRNA